MIRKVENLSKSTQARLRKNRSNFEQTNWTPSWTNNNCCMNHRLSEPPDPPSQKRTHTPSFVPYSPSLRQSQTPSQLPFFPSFGSPHLDYSLLLHFPSRGSRLWTQFHSSFSRGHPPKSPHKPSQALHPRPYSVYFKMQIGFTLWQWRTSDDCSWNTFIFLNILLSLEIVTIISRARLSGILVK